MAGSIAVKDLTGNLKSTYSISGRVTISDAVRISFKNPRNFNIAGKIRTAVNNASLIVALELKQALDDALRSNSWPTLNGTGDIYDTGRLLESGSVRVEGESLIIAYGAPYATLVHYGGYIMPYGRSDLQKIYLPARPWINAVLNGGGPVPEFNIGERFRVAILNQLR